jgi:hypothetical protein
MAFVTHLARSGVAAPTLKNTVEASPQCISRRLLHLRRWIVAASTAVVVSMAAGFAASMAIPFGHGGDALAGLVFASSESSETANSGSVP